MTDSNFVYASGKAYFAQVFKPNKFDRYTIDLVVDKVQAEKLKAKGLKPSLTEDGQPREYAGDDGFVFRIKKNATRSDGTPAKPIVVKDAANDDFKDLIGNGSEVEVCFSVYTGTLKSGKEFVSTNLVGVQVVKHIAFEKPDLFTAKEETTKTNKKVMSADDPFKSID